MCLMYPITHVPHCQDPHHPCTYLDLCIIMPICPITPATTNTDKSNDSRQFMIGSLEKNQNLNIEILSIEKTLYLNASFNTIIIS